MGATPRSSEVKRASFVSFGEFKSYRNSFLRSSATVSPGNLFVVYGPEDFVSK